MIITRRDLLKLGATAGAGAMLGCRAGSGAEDVSSPALAPPRAAPGGLLRRAIPSSGERIPIVGLGTARRYDVGASPEERREVAETLRAFTDAGGSVIDTAPSYGRAEPVVGDLVRELGLREQVFLATKVAGENLEDAARQIGQSFQRLHTDVIDLIQIHNLRGIGRDYRTLLELKEQGRIRHHGVTTSSRSQYEELASHMRTKEFDVVQLNYSLLQREAEAELLPLARDRGMAVLVNLPFGRGSTFARVGSQPLPEWAGEWGIATWGQFFLKWILSHPAVTCVIPGTARPDYARDNMGAARGPMPDEAARQRMTATFDALA